MADLTIPTKFIPRPYRYGDFRPRTAGVGIGVIYGTTKETTASGSVPLRSRVRLFRERDGLFVRETMSDAATGVYTFSGVDEQEVYTVIAYHLPRTKRAEAADGQVPEVLP